MEALFDELDRRLPPPEKWIEVPEGRQSVRLPLGDILWAEHFQHQVYIHTSSAGTLSPRMPFGEFTALLDGDERFFVCGRGVAVNLSRVSDFDGAAFRLSDGLEVPVSRGHADAARRAFGAYLFGKEAGA